MKQFFSCAVTVAIIWYASVLLFKVAWKLLGMPVTDQTTLLLNIAALPVSLYVGWSSFYKN